MNVLKVFFDISLLRATPQDVPYSYQLLILSAFASIVSYILALEPAGPELAKVLGQQNSITVISVAEHAFFAATVWVILKLRGFSPRFVQAMTAMFAVSAMVRLLVWLALGLLVAGQETSDSGFAGVLVFGLSLWIWIVYAYIFKETLEIRFGIGMLFTFISQVATSMLLLSVINTNF